MTSDNQEDGNAIEAQVQILQNTIAQWWNRVQSTELEQLGSSDVTILGNRFPLEEIYPVINSRLWFTYRAGFEPIQKAEDGPSPLAFLKSMIFNVRPSMALGGLFDNQNYSTDVGWGCMIRTSQSLLANALQILILGRDHQSPQAIQSALEKVKRIIQLFGDDYTCPFSLHNFIKVASALPLKVKPGEWFGPSAASLSIKRLCAKFESSEIPNINVSICESCNLYDEEIRGIFEESESPLLILFPLRLGIDKINAIYYPSLLQLLALKQSVGIAGGKPSSSYYFFGFQGSNLLYLDPHNLQASSSDPGTYHTSKFQTLSISNLDPSMLAGVLINDYDDYLDFKETVVKENKIIHFMENSRILQPPTSDYREDFVQVSSDPPDPDIDDFVEINEPYVQGEERQITPESVGLQDILGKYEVL